MKTALILFTALILTSFAISIQQMDEDDLKTTCKVLYNLTDDAIDNDRKDLIAIYYNAYKSIRSTHEITDGCDQYFNGIQTNYADVIGNWTVGLDFPPKLYSPTGGGFTHKEIETLNKLKEMNLTIEDIYQLKLYKGIQENTLDLKLLKSSNTESIKQLNDNLNKLKIENIDYNKLNSLSNDKLNIEQFKQIIK